jgi:predicted CopG family antitoxin
MAVKTITIDVEAYAILARRKKPGQSFSQLVKEAFGRIRTGRDLSAALETVRLSEDSAKSIDRQIRRRSSSRARVAKI